MTFKIKIVERASVQQKFSLEKGGAYRWKMYPKITYIYLGRHSGRSGADVFIAVGPKEEGGDKVETFPALFTPFSSVNWERIGQVRWPTLEVELD